MTSDYFDDFTDNTDNAAADDLGDVAEDEHNSSIDTRWPYN